ncbi:MAG: hypothetical protein WB813_11365, partial [Candidatus Acidiferrales bacterium]
GNRGLNHSVCKIFYPERSLPNNFGKFERFGCCRTAVFFVLLLVLLLHRALWPMVQRPVYALAARGVVRRRKFFFISGLVLIGAGTVPTSTAVLVKKLLKAFEGL